MEGEDHEKENKKINVIFIISIYGSKCLSATDHDVMGILIPFL